MLFSGNSNRRLLVLCTASIRGFVALNSLFSRVRFIALFTNTVLVGGCEEVAAKRWQRWRPSFTCSTSWWVWLPVGKHGWFAITCALPIPSLYDYMYTRTHMHVYPLWGWSWTLVLGHVIWSSSITGQKIMYHELCHFLDELTAEGAICSYTLFPHTSGWTVPSG